MKLPKITEKEFQSQVVQLAKLRGWLCFHDYDSRKSTAGFPDLVLIRGHQILVAELKVGNRKATPEQRQWLEAFAGARVRAFIWTPADWKEIESILEIGPPE